MDKKNKLIVLGSALLVILVIVLGVTYASLNYSSTSTNQDLVLGDIYMHYNETHGLSISDMIPGAPYTDYFEFTINGKNTYSEKDIYYDFLLIRGDLPDGKIEENRIPDKYLKFKLTKVTAENEEEVLLEDKTYKDLINRRIYVETIAKNTANEVNRTYRLYMTIDNSLEIGNKDTAVFTMDEWASAFASIKVKVTGDFVEKELPKSAAEKIIEKTLPYASSSANDFSGGLVGINDSGTLYNETLSEKIREYRYSGLNVDNYVYFNCSDTDGAYDYGEIDYDYENNCEIWRIIGIFKNKNGEWNLKLMKNTFLEGTVTPETYVINETTYTIIGNDWAGSDGLYFQWNQPDVLKSKYYNDWTTSGLQYYLNTERDSQGNLGYYSSITSKTKEMIDENYTYYLGNVSIEGTTITTYSKERDKDNIWEGNKPSWDGKVALMYPSDYGYSVPANYWTTTSIYNYEIEAFETSWLLQTANVNDYEYILSPYVEDYDNYSSDSEDCVIVLMDSERGWIDYTGTDFSLNARPVLNLKSNVNLLKGDGTEELPYVVVS